MTVLVTGASGFLGGRLAQVLAARGDSVRILARRGSDLRHLADVSFEAVYGSLADADCLACAVRGVTHIFHCAGCATDWAPWRVYREANVEGLRNILHAARQVPNLERFLHVSTTDVYGYPRDPCGESCPLSDVGLPYNRTKCLGEECVRETLRSSGLPITIVRPATIYGPRGTTLTTNVVKHIRQGSMGVIDGGRTSGGFCYVDNVVDAMLLAAEARESVGRAYNIADGSGVTWRRYVDALADGLGARRPWIEIPAAAAFPMARIMEAAHQYLRLPGRPWLTRHAVFLFSRNQEYPTGQAQRDFGFSPAVSLEEGIARTIAWLRQELG
jgi:nucleoside-diphosphate-sugar epimerase